MSSSHKGSHLLVGLALFGLAFAAPLATMPAAQAAAAYTVTTQAEFVTALADADPVINITMAADITLTESIVIPEGKTVSITSDTGTRVLLRGAAMTGTTYVGPPCDSALIVAYGALTLTNIILDGNSVNMHAYSALVWGSWSINIGAGTVLRNNENIYETLAPASTQTAGGAIEMDDCAGDGTPCTVTISGGDIYNNSAEVGGAIFVQDATLTITGGKIHDNHAAQGGGVNLYAGSTGTMSGGEIYNNHADLTAFALELDGAGVLVFGSSFTLSGGSIHDNTADHFGGGLAVVVGTGAALTMTGGHIDDNSATDGGGIWFNADRTLPASITGGTIDGNQATTGNGGGINVLGPVHLHIGGTAQVSDNSSSEYGGGVFMSDVATVTIDGTAKLTGNQAGFDGGAIWLGEAYDNLSVAAGVVFANNLSQSAYFLNDPSLIATHDAQIKTTKFSGGFQYGYNNYDINYRSDWPANVVTFDSQGGSAVGPQPVAYNTAATAPHAPTKANAKFTNWCLDKACTQVYNFANPVTADITLYAGWQATSGSGAPGPSLTPTGGQVVSTTAPIAAGLFGMILLVGAAYWMRRKATLRY